MLLHIVPSTKRLHSTLGALGCPLLAGCWASSGHRVCLDKFQSSKTSQNGVPEGASMVLVLWYHWVQQGKVGEEVLGTGRWSPRKARLGSQTSLALQSGMSLGAHARCGCWP